MENEKKELASVTAENSNEDYEIYISYDEYWRYAQKGENMTFEIHFNDLKPEVQEELLDFMGISDPKEMNWDIDTVPIAILNVD